MDRLATGAYYQSGGGPTAVVPPSAQQLTQTVAAFAASGTFPASATPDPTAGVPSASIAQQQGVSESDVLRGQLTQLAPELYELLDAQWKSYLALPSSLFVGAEHPKPEQLAATVRNFDNVATDARFRQLASRPEFQSVYGILKHYQQSLTASSPALQLPPPPSAAAGATR
jgi:hypothetical protein